MKALIFDTETTGLLLHPQAKLSLQPRIIEWGGLIVDEKGNELLELDMLINPGCLLPEKIVKLTGITDEDLALQPLFSVASSSIRRMFEQADILIAHNLPFDLGVMQYELMRCDLFNSWAYPPRFLCTVQEHVEEWGYRPKMTELYQHYMGKPLAQSHRALDDVRALKEICMASGIISRG